MLKSNNYSSSNLIVFAKDLVDVKTAVECCATRQQTVSKCSRWILMLLTEPKEVP